MQRGICNVLYHSMIHAAMITRLLSACLVCTQWRMQRAGRPALAGGMAWMAWHGTHMHISSANAERQSIVGKRM